MVTTIDHISGGRMGLNVTAGYFKPEYDIFGVELPEHDVRYELADEWVEIAERLWANEEQEFDFDGQFFNLKGAQAHPKPVQSPRPMVMSAGSSPAGKSSHSSTQTSCSRRLRPSSTAASSRRSCGRKPMRPVARTWACGPARTSSSRTPRRKHAPTRTT